MKDKFKEITSFPVTLKFEEAKYLGDLFSLQDDLKNTLKTLELLNSKFIDTPIHDNLSNDAIISRALITSALISYTRCFNKGARFGLSTKIFDELSDKEKAKEHHKFYTDLRSKHFAHSINPFEQCKTVALINEKNFINLGWVSISSFSPNMHYLIILTKIALDFVNNQVSISSKIVLDKVKKMTIDELNKLPKASFLIPSSTEVSKKRD